jgi:predicted lipoprotein with Yx(FWY)xxD motif
MPPQADPRSPWNKAPPRRVYSGRTRIAPHPRPGAACRPQPGETDMTTNLARAALLPCAFALALAAFAGAAHAAEPAKAAGGMLVGANGMTLYTFDKDSGGKSACNGPCATNWPPLMAADGDQASGDWSIVTRDDGKKQWAYKGKPLYFWAKDAKPGDATGDGMLNNAWHAAKP